MKKPKPLNESKGTYVPPSNELPPPPPVKRNELVLTIDELYCLSDCLNKSKIFLGGGWKYEIKYREKLLTKLRAYLNKVKVKIQIEG